jgi:hypothetical protein
MSEDYAGLVTRCRRLGTRVPPGDDPWTVETLQRALRHGAAAIEALAREREGHNERVKLLLDAKQHWLDRAVKAEASAAEMQAKVAQLERYASVDNLAFDSANHLLAAAETRAEQAEAALASLCERVEAAEKDIAWRVEMGNRIGKEHEALKAKVEALENERPEDRCRCCDGQMEAWVPESKLVKAKADVERLTRERDEARADADRRVELVATAHTNDVNRTVELKQAEARGRALRKLVERCAKILPREGDELFNHGGGPIDGLLFEIAGALALADQQAALQASQEPKG